MIQWAVLYGKEMLEMRRNFKWLWLPAAFMLLGAMQPVTTHYMPQILEMAGGLPEGAVIEIPVPTGGGMMAQLLGQYSTMGVLVLVLAGMGVVSAEKQSRTAALVMVRPVPAASWITAKWAAYVTIGAVSFFAGCLSGWYYTVLLIGKPEPGHVLAGAAVYAVWLIFVMTVTVLMSTVMRGSGAAAFLSLLVAFVVSFATGLLDRFMQWSPSRMSDHAVLLLSGGEFGQRFALSLAGSLTAIAIMLTIAVWSFKRQELED